MRIAVGGFQHETNTFAPSKAGFDAFAQPDAWPGLVRGPELFDAVAGINLPIAGFIEAARGAGHALHPLSWCSASPSAEVTRDAFERITAGLCDDLARAGRIDAVYLDLHGAMVSEDHEDGEGEILRRARAVVGDDVAVVVSLDLHANVTRAMAMLASALVAYRSYPHVDMAATGARAARLVHDIGARGRTPVTRFRKLPFMIPVTAQCTLFEPMRSVYAHLAALETEAIAGLSFTPGFPPADIAECGPAITVHGWEPAAAEAALTALYDDIVAREATFRLDLHDPEEAVRRARANRLAGPVVLADTQDNPGAGSNSDTVWLLDELVRQGAEGAVVALINDAESAAQAQAAGEGARLSPRLGAKSGLAGHVPFTGEMIVERLGDGRFTGTGPMWRGARMQLGPMALLRSVAAPGVRAIVSSRKLQAADQSIFRHLGVEPAEQRILALKSSVHFRADFQDIAAEVLVVAAPGPNQADPSKYAYRRLREGLRLTPLGAPFKRA